MPERKLGETPHPSASLTPIFAYGDKPLSPYRLRRPLRNPQGEKGIFAKSIPLFQNTPILLSDPAARGGPWIRPRGWRQPLPVLLQESLARRGAARAGLRRRNPMPPSCRRVKREGGRGRRDVFRLSCLRRIVQTCPPLVGPVGRPSKGPLPAIGEPSKEDENEPRGASVPAPKRLFGA
jgi:hypothetical protein